ncbi:alpha/beta hydrolase [Desulfuromonas carbonis]|uniref:alpha/beta hydrolase n=1 Tax=Desulfuromonas sp. DDH964 TaxID=1823759 RepID=UPI00078B28D0|nr:alpha/beta hydrolase [Desulfuromonas sp. DDH964]AMV72912.1 hydrolase [Desulfuromonas sp. DDH964]
MTIAPPSARALLFGLLLLHLPLPGYAMLESQFLYFPSAKLSATPAAAGLDFEEVDFAAADGTRLHGWFLPGDAGMPALLFCHGNGGNIADRIELLRFFHELGLPQLIFDYRGYGRSAGTPSETGTYSDARGALAWLEEKGWPAQRTIYLGRSLGAAIVLQLALEAPPAALVLESGFTSVAAMGRLHYPLLARLFGWVLAAEYDNRARIGQLRAPLLLVHGSADQIVPLAMGEELFALAPEPKRLLVLPDVGHNDLFFAGHPEYRAAWQELLDQLRTEADQGGGE